MLFLPVRRALSRWLLCLLCLALAGQAAAQSAPAPPKVVPAGARRQVAAKRTAAPIKLDGVPDEAAWVAAPVASKFVEQQPRPGRAERLPTEVRVLYDDAAMYVSAKLLEASADSIKRELTQRDDAGNTDFFGIFIDPYRDHLNGYGFIVLSTGVQMDSRYSPANGEDFAWNAVWDSRVAALPEGKGWSVEIRIPYSALRFAPAPLQTWGVNFMRQRKKDNQQLFWNEVKPAVDGFVNQWGELTDLENLHPPLRLSLTPYVSAYANHYPYDEQGKRNLNTSFNAGADLKWGINESFTLDATLIPDFGQTISDNQVLNLSPFEVQYQENRPFFTEGTELFNKGGLFYSRRVGAQPLGFNDVAGTLGQGEAVYQNPGVTRLLNATKVSGRTRKGLGVGVFNAVSAAAYAVVQDAAEQRREVLTQPLTNYNIVVLDQSLPHNSYVSLINTNVTRFGSTYDANVTAGLFKFADKRNQYALKGQVNYSRRRGTVLNSDRAIDDQNGYKYYLNYGKISGNWTWNVDHGIESDSYNPNDLGILFGNNNISQSATVNYNKYEQFGKVNNLYTSLGAYQSFLFKPSLYQDAGLYGNANTTFTKSFLTIGGNVNLDLAKHDYYEPRTFPLGQYYVRVPTSFNLGTFVSSDYRKKVAYDINVGARTYARDGRLPDRPRRVSYGLSLSPRYRVNDQLNFRYTFDYDMKVNQIGYVNDGLDADNPLDQPLLAEFGSDVLLGRRNVSTFTNTLNANYTFTNRLSLTTRVRHYVSAVRYHEFARLRPGGAEEALPAYARNHDTSFSAFNVDAALVWWFAPGSQVSLVWKDATASSLLGNEATPLYFDNLTNVANTPHNNNVSIKVLYYLDYLALRRHKA
jgi:hypothetical protein